MQIELKLNDEHFVRVGRCVPSDHVIRDPEVAKGRNWFTLMPGMPDVSDIEGEMVTVTGKEYSINYRKYDLSSGYALQCKLTPNYQLIPVLRKAVGREITLSKDENGMPDNAYWPILEKVEILQADLAPEQEEITQEALQTSTNITEHFNGYIDEDDIEEPLDDEYSPETISDYD